MIQCTCVMLFFTKQKLRLPEAIKNAAAAIELINVALTCLYVCKHLKDVILFWKYVIVAAFIYKFYVHPVFWDTIFMLRFLVFADYNFATSRDISKMRLSISCVDCVQCTQYVSRQQLPRLLGDLCYSVFFGNIAL